MAPEESSPRRAFELVTEAFGPGYAGPLTVVVDGDGSATVRAEVEQLDDVAAVSPTRLSDSGETAVFSVTPAEVAGDSASYHHHEPTRGSLTTTARTAPRRDQETTP
jgi:RND superfamily putative drug exporter